jgi:hypothetical protein
VSELVVLAPVLSVISVFVPELSTVFFPPLILITFSGVNVIIFSSPPSLNSPLEPLINLRIILN